MNFTHMAQDFHIEGITGVDVSTRKPLVATCSSDHTVRLWNYMDKSTELVRSFPEEAFSVALHPHGLSLLVGHGDKLRLLTILLDDMRVIKEFPIKSCRECRFSHGGAMFAAVNSNTIQVCPPSPCAAASRPRPDDAIPHSLTLMSVCLDLQHVYLREHWKSSRPQWQGALHLLEHRRPQDCVSRPGWRCVRVGRAQLQARWGECAQGMGVWLAYQPSLNLCAFYPVDSVLQARPWSCRAATIAA